MDFQFFHELLSFDSTSGKEWEVAEWLIRRLPDLFPPSNRPDIRAEEVGDDTINLLLTWGEPKLVFCSHLDTVPPYIAPTFPKGVEHDSPQDSFAPLGMTKEMSLGMTDALSLGTTPSCHSEEVEDRRKNLTPGETSSVIPNEVPPVIPGLISPVIPGLTGNLLDIIAGRGTCDAKGQVFAMVTACQKLAEEGCTDFGLLLLAGEETGSWGAKAFAKTGFKADYLVVGEPTDNCMVSASKGTKSYDLKFTGVPFHSGYPEHGVSAVDLFVDFVNRLREQDFGIDPVLGETTWNIGLLKSDNPQNILSPELTCRLYFRTTFVSDEAVTAWMDKAPDVIPGLTSPVIPGLTGNLTVTPRGGDTPARYWTVPGLPTKCVAFGSDAPHLKNFKHKAICGPGSINVAHRDDEHVLVADLETAVEQYIALYRAVKK